MLISKYVYSRPTYLYTNIQTFDNVWLKCPETTARETNTAARVQHCIQQGESCCEFFMVAELCLTRGISKQQQ